MASVLEKLRLDLPTERGGAEIMAVSVLAAISSVLITALVIYGAYFGLITALILRSIFFSLVSFAGLLYVGIKSPRDVVRYGCYFLAIVSLVPGFHLWQNYTDIILRGAMASPPDLWIFIGLMAGLLVLTRLALGWALVVLVVIGILYAYFGYLIPGKYGHGGYDLWRLTSTLMLSTEGVYGVPMGVAVEYIFLFALLGSLLMRIGTGEVFVDIARGITGRVQGGPGLSAALSSTLMGTINGSAVANVVTTGTFTIPLMKRAGYAPATAAGIEAAAASAGQILPPVMGAAAFLMAEIIGMPYGQIALAAIIPSALYVIALMVAVRLEAGRLDLERDAGAGLGLLKETLIRRGYLLLPLFALVGFLIDGYTPTQAAVICIVFGLLVSPWHRDTRVGLIDLALVCRDTLVSTLPIIAAVAAAGAVIGILNLTGLGLMLSGLIVELGGSNIWLILVLTALTSFVLGMGLPTSAAYLLLAVLVAPALTQLGVPVLVAHMFIFYYGLVSAITPPVAMAAFAAASIAGSDVNKTGYEAVRLGFVKLLVPFLFVSMPGLLLIGTPAEIVLSTMIALIGTVSLSIAFAGWLVRPLRVGERLMMAVASLLVLWPTHVTADDPATLAARIIGIVGLAVLVYRAAISEREAGVSPSLENRVS
jgi:TRAP transporter 4TM/12TM fusion protein